MEIYKTWLILGCMVFVISHANQYNILFLVIDDLRPALGVYGDNNAFTPNIDKLAQNSFIFKNAFCQQASCATSRYSFLTSRRPDSLYLYDSSNYWKYSVRNFTTIPQYFRNNNYFTHSIGKIFGPETSLNLNGDTEYNWSTKPYHPVSEKFEDAKVCLSSSGSLVQNLICPVIVKEQPGGILPDLESLNAALDFIRNANAVTNGLPYFLAVGFHKPHAPFRFPLEFLKYHQLSQITLPAFRWKPPSLPSPVWNSWIDIRKYDDINTLNMSLPYGVGIDDVIKKIIQSYSATVTYIDHIIGILLSEVDKDTIIVLVGDHGWSLGEHGEFSKYSNYDITTQVPLIIRVPNMLQRKSFVNELVELVDLFPTLVDLSHISPSLETCKVNTLNSILCTEGRSLFPLLMSKVDKRFPKYREKSAVFTQQHRTAVYSSKCSADVSKEFAKEIQIMGYSVRTKTHRYTEWIEISDKTLKPDWNNVFERELYDHIFDPNENLNLANKPEMKDLIQVLRRQLIMGWRYA